MTGDRAADYLVALRSVSDLLYDVDPYEMGSSIHAPRDEYDEFAARLLAALKSSKTLEDGQAELARLGWRLDSQVVQRIWQILGEADLHAR